MTSADTLREAFSDKARTRALEAIAELEARAKEADFAEDQLRQAIDELSLYDTTFSTVTIEEGIRRLRAVVDEQSKETALLRALAEKAEGAMTKAKVALMNDLTADHRWHPPEDNCPHARCVALNAIEDLRAD